MGMLFDTRELSSSPELLAQLVSQEKKKKEQKVKTKSGGSLLDKIHNICSLVQAKLGKYADQLCLIRTEEELHRYIDVSIKNGVIAIDTETTGLDPITDQIVGACIYTYGEKPAYIPINHMSFFSNQRLKEQLSNEVVATEFQRLVDADTKIIMFNAKFDIRVIRHQLGVFMTPAHCGFIAAKCLKNNEPEANLKALWVKYCAKDKDEPTLTFDKMFKGLNFALVPIDTAYLYAAKDALMTLDLYDFQMQYLTEDNEKCINSGLQRIAKLYREIELPIINITADIEDRGVCIDTSYAQELSVKYNDKLVEIKERFYRELKENYQTILDDYLIRTPKTKIETPMNMASDVQLAELLYDCFQIPPVSKKSPRGTGKEILQEINHPLGNIILEFREVAKLLSTYIDKLPKVLNKKTNRIHCSFNQYGTDTGRYSSSDPNLQNIPSHNKDIRPMFVATREIDVESDNNRFNLFVEDLVMTLAGEKNAQDLTKDDTLICDDGNYVIQDIQIQDEIVTVTV